MIKYLKNILLLNTILFILISCTIKPINKDFKSFFKITKTFDYADGEDVEFLDFIKTVNAKTFLFNPYMRGIYQFNWKNSAFNLVKNLEKGYGPGEIKNFITDIAIDNKGNFWVAENYKINKYDKNFNFIKSFKTNRNIQSVFCFQNYILVCGVRPGSNFLFSKYDYNGNLIEETGKPFVDNLFCKKTGRYSFKIYSSGNLIFVPYIFEYKIGVYNPNGNLLYVLKGNKYFEKPEVKGFSVMGQPNYLGLFSENDFLYVTISNHIRYSIDIFDLKKKKITKELIFNKEIEIKDRNCLIYKNNEDCLFRKGNGIAIGKFLFDY